MFSKILTLAIAGAAPLAVCAAAHAQDVSGSANLTQTCHFTSGARNGATIDFSATPNTPSVPIGSHCGDMTGSNGVAVASEPHRRPGQGRFYRTPQAPVGLSPEGGVHSGYTRQCHFTSGPQAGATFDFTGTLGALPVRTRSTCSDGKSSGIAVGE